jgi:hypothetical protein
MAEVHSTTDIDWYMEIKELSSYVRHLGKREIKKSMMKLSIFDKMILSEFLFQHLQELFTCTDLNNSFNVSRKLQILKRSKFCWKMNREYSLKYHKDTNYRARLDLLLTNGRTQLSLNLSQFSEVDIANVLENVHSLNLRDYRNVTDVSTLGNVHTLDIRFCGKIRDVGALINVHTLDNERLS